MGNRNSKQERDAEPRGLAPDGRLPDYFGLYHHFWTTQSHHFRIGQNNDFWYKIEASEDCESMEMFRDGTNRTFAREPFAWLDSSGHPSSKYMFSFGEHWKPDTKLGGQNPGSNHSEDRLAGHPGGGSAAGDKVALIPIQSTKARIGEHLTFEIPSPFGASEKPEVFAWCAAHYADGEKLNAKHSTAAGYKLVRSNTGEPEVVVLFMPSGIRSKFFHDKIGYVEFVGSAKRGTYGEVFGALVIMSLCRMKVSYYPEAEKMHAAYMINIDASSVCT